jgi:hypothetical protein
MGYEKIIGRSCAPLCPMTGARRTNRCFGALPQAPRSIMPDDWRSADGSLFWGFARLILNNFKFHIIYPYNIILLILFWVKFPRVHDPKSCLVVLRNKKSV